MPTKDNQAENKLRDAVLKTIKKLDLQTLINLCLREENITSIIPLIISALRKQYKNELNQQQEQFEYEGLLKQVRHNKIILKNQFYFGIQKSNDVIYDIFLDVISRHSDSKELHEISKAMKAYTATEIQIQTFSKLLNIRRFEFSKTYNQWDNIQRQISTLKAREQEIRELLQQIWYSSIDFDKNFKPSELSFRRVFKPFRLMSFKKENLIKVTQPPPQSQTQSFSEFSKNLISNLLTPFPNFYEESDNESLITRLNEIKYTLNEEDQEQLDRAAFILKQLTQEIRPVTKQLPEVNKKLTEINAQIEKINTKLSELLNKKEMYQAQVFQIRFQQPQPLISISPRL